MKQEKINLLKLNIHLLKNNSFNIFIDFFVWVLINLMPLILAFLFKSIFDSLQNNFTDKFYAYCIIAEFFVITQSCIIILGGKVDTIMRFDIKQKLSKKILKASIESKQNNSENNSAIVEFISNDINSYEELISLELDILCKIIFALFSVVSLCSINYKIVIFIFLPVAIINRLLWVLKTKIGEKYTQQRESDFDYTSYTKDILSNRELIQYNLLGDYFFSNLEPVLSKRKRMNIKNKCFKMFVQELSDAEGIISNICILLALLFLNDSVKITAGDFSMIILLGTYLSQYNGLFGELIEAFQHVKVSNKIIEKNLGNSNFLQYTCKDKSENYNPIKVLSVNIMINKKSVKFKLNAGDILVISGGNGSHKTHLLDMLLGYAPYEGIIKINNTVTDYLKGAAVSLQNPNFINDTVCNNLFIQPSHVATALERVNLKHELEQYIDGKTFIGVNGSKFSSGQRQRLSILRALESNSSIYIFDDSFRHIDKENWTMILSQLKDFAVKQNCIIIFVTNIAEVSVICDVHIDMDKLMME